MSIGPTETESGGALGDAGLEGHEIAATWYVYRARAVGAPLPAGVRASSPGTFTTKLTGPLDLDTLRKTVGPGTWRLIGKVGGSIRYTETVEIAGVPWDPARFNRQDGDGELEPEPDRYAPRAARAAALGVDEIAAIIRRELDARLPPAAPPAGPAGPWYPPAPPADPAATFQIAMQMAQMMTSSAKTTDSMEGMFRLVLDSFDKGRKIGASAVRGEGPDDSSLGEILKSVLPALLPLLAGKPAAEQAPAARGAQAIPQGSAAVPIQAPPAAAVHAGSPNAPSARDHVVNALARVLRGEAEAERLPGALDFYLGDADLEAFSALGTTGNLAGDFLAWVGPTSPLLPLAQGIASRPEALELVRNVQAVLLEQLDEYDHDEARARRVEPAAVEVVTPSG